MAHQTEQTELPGPQDAVQTENFDARSQPQAVPYSSMQFPLSSSAQGWRKRPRNPGLKWYKGYDTPESLKHGRVLVIDYIKHDQSRQGMRKVAAQEISSLERLQHLYSNPKRCNDAVLRVLHCQNADWAIPFLLHKYNITSRDDLVGTDFGKYVKYKRPERRGNKIMLSGKSFKTVHDPWRGISQSAFGLDYLKHYKCPKSRVKGGDEKDKIFEMNYYNEDDHPAYGWDIFVQRLSCYVQHKEATQEIPDYLENPYQNGINGPDIKKEVPDLQLLDNGNCIIIFENSQSGSVEDTAIAARQQLESRWRRLPFYLPYESQEALNDATMALECMKIVLQDIWKSIAEQWEGFLDICNDHVSILEEKIYEQPADESRAPELWTNSAMWLKVERIVAIHESVMKEMQNNLREFLGENEVKDNWLEASPDDMQKIRDLVEENLTKPTANLADLMYKSVGIRDSRHSLQLDTSMWRSDPGYPSIRYYFASAIPMMVLVLVLWYIVKHLLARRRQTPYQRGVYEQLFFELATAYPRLWTRSGPDENVQPRGILDRLKWYLVTIWNDPAKTVSKGDPDDGYDDLGAWARCKRSLTRRWTSQISSPEQNPDDATTKLEAGGIDHWKEEHRSENQPEKGAKIIRTAATGDPPGGELVVSDAVPATTFMSMQTIVSRPSSSGSGMSNSQRNSGVIVEEEPSTWLRDYGSKINDVKLY